MKRINFVIPCYRSEKTIESVISSIVKKMKERPEFDYEIIAVNDCSPDNTFCVLKELAKDNKKLKVINLTCNVGKHAAILAAYRFVNADYVINLDDDGQCPIEELWNLLLPIERGHDMSMARYLSKKQGFIKNLGSSINNMIAQVTLEKPKDLVFTNFIARQEYICKAMAEYANIFPYLEGLTLKITRDIVLVPMEEKERLEGVSGYTLRKSTQLLINGLTAFSVKPLRIALVIGVSTAMLGFIFGVITIIRKYLNPNIIVGYSSIIAAIMFCSGMIMMLLGIIGEYVGRIYISVNRYPQYVIKEILNMEEQGACTDTNDKLFKS